MDEIAVVKRRTRIWPLVLMLLLVACFVLTALWMMGYFEPTTFEFNALVAPMGGASIAAV
ncbi:MAG TPA: hypothetical protein VIK60_08660 [Vicinamibacterales bacterium]